MKKWLLNAKHVAVVAIGFLVVAVPAVVATPAVRNYLANHPVDAGYFAVAAGLVSAVYKAWETRSKAP